MNVGHDRPGRHAAAPRSPTEALPVPTARRHRGLARRIPGRAADRPGLHLRGRRGAGPGGQGRRRPDARPPPRRGRRRPRSDAFQERLAARAIELCFHAGPDAIGGSLKMLVKHADEAIDLLALALAKPRFDPDAIERVRGQTLAGLRYQQNDPGVMASRRFFAEAFAGHPYGRPVLRARSRASRRSPATTSWRCIARSSAAAAVKVAAVGAIDAARLAESARPGLRQRSTMAGPLKRGAPDAGCRTSAARVRGRPRRAAIRDPLRHERRAVARPGLHPGLRPEPHPGRRLLHLAPVPGGAREARPRLFGRARPWSATAPPR